MQATEEVYQLQCLEKSNKKESEITFSLPEKCTAVLKILNASEHEVRMLINEELTEGTHTICFTYGNLKGNYTIKLIIKCKNIIDINTLQIQIPFIHT
ncbi:MAG TPA: hypothetical protein VGP43_04410 [Chitinophagaceae bacterium]|nr:hypothetical protein [Chitinophagaceae bacterium]